MDNDTKNKVTISLWIGENFASEEEYLDYFHAEPWVITAENILDPEPTSKFGLDLGDADYGREFLVVPDRYSSLQDINKVIENIEVNEDEKGKILDHCKKLGINKANAAFWHVNRRYPYYIEMEEPPKDSYNGLKYVGEFNADTKYPSEETPNEINSYDYLWIGTNNMPVDEYEKYFELDYNSEDIFDPEYKICGFCKDTGNVWYDEDWIGYPKPLKKEVDIHELLKIVLEYDDEETFHPIIEACQKLGITKGNSLVWYTVNEGLDDFKVSEPYKDNYNGLKYIGAFNVF